VIDATNVQPEARQPLITLAREYHCLAVAIVFDTPADICQAQNRQRADRHFSVSPSLSARFSSSNARCGA
jgi:protein phosphatase